MASTKARLLKHDFPVHGKIWRILAGLFLEDFSVHFPTKTRRKTLAN